MYHAFAQEVSILSVRADDRSIGISSAAFGAIITTTETQVGTGGTSTFTPVYPIATANNVLYQIGSVTPPAGGSVTPGSGNFQQEAAGGVAVLTDASFGPINSGVTGNHLEFATVGNNGGTSLVYKFNAAALSKLEVYGGWNDLGRDDVDVTISYSTNGGSTFNTLTTIAYAPNIAAGIQSASKIVVTDDTGQLWRRREHQRAAVHVPNG